jgi:hypothetical protein
MNTEMVFCPLCTVHYNFNQTVLNTILVIIFNTQILPQKIIPISIRNQVCHDEREQAINFGTETEDIILELTKRIL